MGAGAAGVDCGDDVGAGGSGDEFSLFDFGGVSFAVESVSAGGAMVGVVEAGVGDCDAGGSGLFDDVDSECATVDVGNDGGSRGGVGMLGVGADTDGIDGGGACVGDTGGGAGGGGDFRVGDL